MIHASPSQPQPTAGHEPEKSTSEPETLALVIRPRERRIDPPPSAELIAAFSRQEWRGNVRELRSAVERAILMRDPSLWFESTLGYTPGEGEPGATSEADYSGDLAIGSFRAAKERVVARWERGYLEALVHKCGGNISKAAREARMDRNHLRDLLRRHGSRINDDERADDEASEPSAAGEKTPQNT